MPRLTARIAFPIPLPFHGIRAQAKQTHRIATSWHAACVA
jgi:hypothetical protein